MLSDAGRLGFLFVLSMARNVRELRNLLEGIISTYDEPDIDADTSDPVSGI